MGNVKLEGEILNDIGGHPLEYGPHKALFDLCRNEGLAGRSLWLRERLMGEVLPALAKRGDWGLMEKFDTLCARTLWLRGRDSFEDYLLGIDWGKPYDKKFYLPRRRYLKRYVDAYQGVLDGGLDFLSISMPKRCGKSQLGINFICMVSGRNPEGATLAEGSGTALVKSFYRGVLEYLDPKSEYHFYDIFPEHEISDTQADVLTLNLNSRNRFPTLMCRSIDSTQVGLSEATNLLYLDDCVEGREEAKNRSRLEDKWEVISGDILGRAIEGTPVVICGTRYSIHDPIGKLQAEMLKQDMRSVVLETPALDPETDTSNFEYTLHGKKRFTTTYFRHQRSMLTDEQFESEFQQRPFEAKGVLFPEKSLNYYYGLPKDRDPDAVVAVCDTAEKGSDYCALAVAYVYGTDVYIEDVVFDDAPPASTKPKIADCLMRHRVGVATFESNNAGEYFARDVDTLMVEKGYSGCSVRTKRTISNKQTRIEFASTNIIRNFYFKDYRDSSRGREYMRFMKNVTGYVRNGKVEHDDAPDVLSLLENELRHVTGGSVEVMTRFF